jgi:hypothetical protein
MNTAESIPFETPAHLVEVLDKKPVTKAELMTYLANLQTYAEFHLEEAKSSNVRADHPFHSDEGRDKCHREIGIFMGVFEEVQKDIRSGRLQVQGSERRVGDIVGEVMFIFEKAAATYQMPFRGHN